jgi:hypothetical protein
MTPAAFGVKPIHVQDQIYYVFFFVFVLALEHLIYFTIVKISTRVGVWHSSAFIIHLFPVDSTSQEARQKVFK